MPLSDEDRLRLENATLLQLVQGFANMRSEHPEIVRKIEHTRQVLSLVKRRKKLGRVHDEVEDACFHVVNSAREAGLKDPVLILQRFSKNDWEAHVERYEGSGAVGVGTGSSPVAALRDLLGLVRGYVARCKKGV